MDASKKRIFISKDRNELRLLPTWCDQMQHELVAHSFLSFQAVEFFVSKSFDLVFLASPRAAQFFLKNYSPSYIPFSIAVAGSATRLVVEEMGFNVVFHPTNGGLISESSQDFADFVGKRTVLFPISDISQLSYSKKLAIDQFETVICYQTIIGSKPVEKCDYYLFTSPSNVKGFLIDNEITDDSKIVAWGETTKKYLQNCGVINGILTLSTSTEEEVITLLSKKN